MLWTIVIVLVVLWALGFSLKLGGNLLHTLLVIAAIILVVNLLS